MSATTQKRCHVWMLVLLLVGTPVVSCGPKDDRLRASGELEGTITVSGAFALYPMMIRWSEEFHKLHPGVTFDISAGGAGKGMADALGGAVDIGMVSRAIFQEEIERGSFGVAVAKDAVVATANAQNPVLEQLLTCGITRATCEGIWITGEVTTWGQVINSEATDNIHVYTRADACGAAETWANYLGDYKQEDLQGIAVQADPGLAEAVRQDPLGIGYNNLNFAYSADTDKPLSDLQVIPLDLNDNGRIDPEESFYDFKASLMRAIAEGRYPSPPSRALNLVTKGKPGGLVKTFIEWVLTEGQLYLWEVGYVQLTQEQLDGELSKSK
jgi:phosphate transport system substrate-binding protein